MPTVLHNGRALAPTALLLTSLCAGCMGSDLSSAGWSGPPFSAELVDSRHADRSPTRIYMGDQKVRLETTEGSRPAFVFDPVHRTLLLISPENKTYLDAGMLAPLAAAGIGPLMRFVRPVAAGDPCVQWNSTVDEYASFMKKRSDTTKPHFTCQDMGSESVNGRSAHKWRVASNEKHDEGTVWIDDRLHILAKSLDNDGGMELRNIREGSQPATLFEAPAGYRKLGLSEMLAALKEAGGTTTSAGAIDDSSSAARAGQNAAANAMQKVKDALSRP